MIETKKIVEKLRQLDTAGKRLNKSRRAVLAAILVTLGFSILRLAFTDGIQGLGVTVALLVVDVGIVSHLHIEAMAFRERYESWRKRCEGHKQKQQLLKAAENDLQLVKVAHNEVKSEIQQLVAKLRLRERLNFDLQQISTAAAAAVREGYLSGVDTNKGRYTA